MKQYSLYSLNCPKTGEVMYIGQSDDLKHRHYTHCIHPETTLKKWIHELWHEDLYPIMHEIEIVKSRALAIVRERELILYYSIVNPKLLNRSGNPNFKKLVLPKINYLKK